MYKTLLFLLLPLMTIAQVQTDEPVDDLSGDVWNVNITEDPDMLSRYAAKY